MAKPPELPAKPDPRAEREARLATALRANLRKRKAQARARKASTDEPGEAPPRETPRD